MLFIGDDRAEAHHDIEIEDEDEDGPAGLGRRPADQGRVATCERRTRSRR